MQSMLQDMCPLIRRGPKRELKGVDKIYSEGITRHGEIDIMARNGQEVVAVEVKSTLGVPEVDHFLNVLKRFTLFFPEYKDKKIYGAVAYLKLYESADRYAIKKGLFVIKATGDSACIINKKDFKPLDFSQK